MEDQIQIIDFKNATVARSKNKRIVVSEMENGDTVLEIISYNKDYGSKKANHVNTSINRGRVFTGMKLSPKAVEMLLGALYFHNKRKQEKNQQP